MYLFKCDDIASALLESKNKRGIKIRLLMDQKAANSINVDSYPETYKLVKDKLCTVMVPNPNEFILFHSKVMIIDDKMVGMGSFNFTKAAANDHHEEWAVIRTPKEVKQMSTLFEMKWKKYNIGDNKKDEEKKQNDQKEPMEKDKNKEREKEKPTNMKGKIKDNDKYSKTNQLDDTDKGKIKDNVN